MNFIWSDYGVLPEECARIRNEVFVSEQGFDSEFDEQDHASYHLLATENGVAVATARLFGENVMHAGRICVVKSRRGGGTGTLIMQEIERKAKELNAAAIELSAQLRAKGFYEKAGYTEYGKEYLDEHCPHIMMKKTL